MPRRLRVCIVTPGALGSNPRVVKEAQALHDAGYEVAVVATRTLAHVDSRDDTILSTAGWRSLRLDFRARGMIWRLRRAAQLACAGAFRVTNNPQLADRAFSPFTGSLAAAVKREAADLYIAHYPAALPAVARAAHHHRAIYAFDAEDFHLGDWPEEPVHHNKRRTVRAIEASYLPSCAYVTAASPGIASAYVGAYGIPRPTVVLNVFPLAHTTLGPTPAGAVEPGPSVYWFSQTIGPDRGLECAVQAIAHARTRPHLYLRGSPAVGFIDRLEQIAAPIGVADRLHILPPAAPNEMSTLAAAYDVGLSSETGHSPNRRVALTNKLFTYLLGGLPVVMSDIAAHCALAPDLGTASFLYAKEDAVSLAKALDILLGDPAALAAARTAAFHLGQTRFNWEVEKVKFLERVGTVLQRHALVQNTSLKSALPGGLST